MRVWFYPLDTWGCGHYRMYWPMEAVARLDAPDVELRLVQPEQRKVLIEFDSKGRLAKEHFPAVEGDVIVFQRATSKFQPAAIDVLQARGVACVLDMDDDLSSIHPRNVAHWQMRPNVPQFDRFTGRVVNKTNVHSWHNVAEACRRAALVTVTTDQLARVYGSHGRVAVIPNCVPELYLDIPHEDGADIGWGGTVSTHPDDLQQVGPAIRRLVADGAVFRNVGDAQGIGRALGLTADPPSTGPVMIEQYAVSIATFGIGIAPLADTRFNRAKSRLKPLEYAAVGVPWVGSALPDYVKFHGEGCGMIADKPRAWEGALRRLIRDPVLRAELSDAGREVAARNTMEGNAWRWLDAWRHARDLLDTLPARIEAPSPPPTRREWRPFADAAKDAGPR